MARQYRIQSMDLYNKLGISSIPSKSKTISIFEEGSSTFYLTSKKHMRATSTLPQRPKFSTTRIQSPIKFDKQLPRPDICKYSPNVNPNRFLTFNHSPLSLSNTKRISSPNFTLYQGRKKSLMYTSLEDQPHYDPNYSQVYKNTDRGLVAFNKTQGRRESRPHSTDFSRDIDYSCIDKKINSPLLAKSQAKPCDPILPAFMLSTITRGNMLTQKALEMNCYKVTEFLPLGSTFGKGWHQNEKISPLPIRGKCPKIVKMLTKTLTPSN